MLITFLSDFGTDDVFVGLCHGVIARDAPHARIVDLTHAVPPQDVLTGACRLRDCMPYLPQAVHLAVVDPGVGTRRRCLILQAGSPSDPSWFVGPDNGLLVPAARQLGTSISAWEISPDDRSSATFHGRDVFAPAAARLAAGVHPAELAAPIDQPSLIELAEPRPLVRDGALVTAVRDIDCFGNIQLFARREDLATLIPEAPTPQTSSLGDEGQAGDRRIDIDVAGGSITVALASTFGALEPGEIGLIVDSFGWLAIVVGAGNAAERLSAGRRHEVRLSSRQA